MLLRGISYGIDIALRVSGFQSSKRSPGFPGHPRMDMANRKLAETLGDDDYFELP
jgi:hypothetical protein